MSDTADDTQQFIKHLTLDKSLYLALFQLATRRLGVLEKVTLKPFPN